MMYRLKEEDSVVLAVLPVPCMGRGLTNQAEGGADSPISVLHVCVIRICYSVRCPPVCAYRICPYVSASVPMKLPMSCTMKGCCSAILPQAARRQMR